MTIKQKLLFITHGYHKKTKSCDFIVKYLKNFYKITIIYDNSYATDLKQDLVQPLTQYNVVVFWQIPPIKRELISLSSKRVVFFPMYDACRNWNIDDWFPYRKIKIVNFSYALHKKLKCWGFDSLYVQYFPKPAKFQPGSINNIFLWQRTSISIIEVLKLIGNMSVKIHLHAAIDPGYIFRSPSNKQRKKYHITQTAWFKTKKSLLQILSRQAVYIAPRMSEGIGMGFLEAMAMGKVIIANNEPTMNEYIQHGVTGYLVDFNNPKQIDLIDIKSIQKNAYSYIKNGYRNWLKNRENILIFIQRPSKKYILNQRAFRDLIYRTTVNILHKLKKLIFILFLL